MNRTLSFLSFFLIFNSGLYAQESITIDSSETDKIIKTLQDSLNIPGIAVGIAINDEIKYMRTFGYADIESKTLLTINSVWHICSVSKQFTTVACLRLAEENKLSLNDKISKYIDHLPSEYTDITIRNLLSHTSGIKDYLNEKDLFGLPWEKVKSEIIADTLNFKPGTEWRYSNTGFWMVARIIEKVTSMDYNQYLEQAFFTKLEMDQTHRLSAEQKVNQNVTGYVLKSDKLCSSGTNISSFYGQGDGDLMSTLPDLLKWNIALEQGNILQKESTKLLWTPSILENGKILETFPDSGVMYGLGWFIKEIIGNKIVWTPGAGFGFSISSQYIPRHKLNIIVFCNRDQFLMADEIGFSIAKNLLQ